MKIRTDYQMKMFEDALSICSGYVALVDTSTGAEYDLGDKKVRQLALDMLREDYNEVLELFVSRREDAALMIRFMNELHGRRYEEYVLPYAS